GDVREGYVRDSNTWLPAGNMSVGRYLHAQTTLASGDVLVAGGFVDDDRSTTTEVFHGLPAGGACTSDGECALAHCIDGVCCDQPCKAACYACSAAQKG